MIKEFVEKINIKESVNIVFFGDSVTHGYFESHEKMHGTVDYDAVYHNRLRKKIEYVFPGKTINIINSGVGGENAQMGIKRLEKDVISHNPDLAVVCFGLNDIIHKNESDYLVPMKQIFLTLKENGIPVIFMTPNMLNTKPVDGFLREYSLLTASYQNDGKMDLFIKHAADIAKSEGVYVCDCYNKWKSLFKCGVDINRLLANGVNHPLRDMHELFAQSLFEIIFYD